MQLLFTQDGFHLDEAALITALEDVFAVFSAFHRKYSLARAMYKYFYGRFFIIKGVFLQLF